MESMEFVEIGNMSKCSTTFHSMCNKMYMSGLDGDYICENDYVVVLKREIVVEIVRVQCAVE